MVRPGIPAPAFKAQAYIGGEFKTVSLEEFKGKWVVLNFYPLDFTFVCPTELVALGEKLGEFKKRNAVVLSCSTDSVYSHKAWAQTPELKGVDYPMIADYTKQMSRDYGVLDEEKGLAYRGTFIIDDKGILQYMVVSALSVGRNVEELLRAVDALQTGELCPANWKAGDKTLSAGKKK